MQATLYTSDGGQTWPRGRIYDSLLYTIQAVIMSVLTLHGREDTTRWRKWRHGSIFRDLDYACVICFKFLKGRIRGDAEDEAASLFAWNCTCTSESTDVYCVDITSACISSLILHLYSELLFNTVGLSATTSL